MQKKAFTAATVAAFVLGLVFSWSAAFGGDSIQVDDADIFLESGSWKFIEKTDYKCVDSGTSDYCEDETDDVCNLGIKKNRAGVVLEKKCQN